MGKGRPTKSEIRQNVVDILFYMKSAYGYEIYKIYKKLFPLVSMRVIYYHLKKGTSLEEFRINRIEKEKGNYSWGETAEKIYYSLGQKAKPTGNERVKQHFENATN